MRLLSCILLIIIVGSWPGECRSFKVKLSSNGQFVDDYGRIRIFHGFNAVLKRWPWYDNQMLNDTKLELLRRWGFNIVRLGAMWAGVEPMESIYNETYLGILKQIVHKLDQYGLYSLLDMHQDVLSSKFDGYDGAPLWLVNQFPKIPDIYEYPFPFKESSNRTWAANYFTYAASDAFQNLYKMELSLSHWAGFWTKIAKTFNNETGVIGYELINEPWIGNFYENAALLTPGYAGRYNLLPVYDRLVKAIRRIDNNTLIFYEPVTYGAYLPSTGYSGSGFDRVPGGDDQRSKSVLSYHYYCFFLNSFNAAMNYPGWLRTLCDTIFARSLFQSVQKDTKATGGGLMLTEFGLCSPDGNPDSVNTIECDEVLKLADEHMQSYTYWDSYFFGSDGEILPHALKSFARTYPRAIQGQPKGYSFNKTDGVFHLTYNIDLTISACSDIFIPISVHYHQGFQNVTFPFMITTFDKDNLIFSLCPTTDIKQNSTITLTIRPNH